MWHEYPIPADFEKQKEIIRTLRQWIQTLEKENLISGYAFDHYFNNAGEPDELRIRFQYSDEQNRDNVESQLEGKVKKLIQDYVKQERTWGLDTTDRHILQAYEFGSRCAFLAWELIENKRFPEEYFSDFYVGENEKGVIIKQPRFEFQFHLNHGAMNSLGIPKKWNELLIHLQLLMDCTKTNNKQELIDWLQKSLKDKPPPP